MNNCLMVQDLVRSGCLELHLADLLGTPPASWLTLPNWERIEGMMLGLAVGDALGNTSESMNPSARRASHGEIRDYLPNRHAKDAPVGLPSDDTQLAFWTLDQLNHDGGLMPERMAHRFAGGEEIYGSGRTMREFLRNVKSGQPWHASGPHSAGNGALMRIAPVLIPHLRTADERLWADTVLLALMTHNDPASNASCVAFTSLLWQLLGMDRPPEPIWWLQTFGGMIRQLYCSGMDYAPRGGKWAGSGSREFWSYIFSVVGKAWEQGLSTLDACNSWHSGAYLLETVPSVIYILMKHGHDPEEAIVRAVNDTRDNDTVAAIVGAAVGALHGRAALPRRWINGLLGRTGAHDDGRIFEILDEAKRHWWGSDEASPVITDHSAETEAIRSWLGQVQLGEGLHHAGLTIFPLAAPNGHQPSYHLLQDALDNKTATVTEVSEGGSVPELAIDYGGDLPLLILEGDVLVGAKQNRTVNLTLLVPARVSAFVIPVSCVEQGRWHHVSPEFALKRHAPSDLRSVKVASSLANKRHTGQARSDQGAVWEKVGHVLDDISAESATASLEDGYARVEAELRNWREQCHLPQGTTGFVVARGSRVIGLDLFDHASTAARCWERLAESYFMDQLRRQEAAPPTPQGRVKEFLEQAGHGLRLSEKTAGLGRDVEIDQPEIVGSGVWHEGRLIHLAVFARQ